MEQRVFRAAQDHDFEQIDAIRAEHGSVAPRMEDVSYYVSDRNGRVTAFFGLKMDGPTRALVVDFYGTKAFDWRALFEKLCVDADKAGVELSAWVFLNNKNLRYFERDGFKKMMYLVRRAPRGGESTNNKQQMKVGI
jgi:hypothetical protein